MQGITNLHLDGDLNRSVMWTDVADVVRPLRVLFLRGDERMESNNGCGKAPVRLCFRSGDYKRSGSSFSSCQVECGVAAAIGRWVSHGGGLLGVVRSALS